MNAVEHRMVLDRGGQIRRFRRGRPGAPNTGPSPPGCRPPCRAGETTSLGAPNACAICSRGLLDTRWPAGRRCAARRIPGESQFLLNAASASGSTGVVVRDRDTPASPDAAVVSGPAAALTDSRFTMCFSLTEPTSERRSGAPSATRTQPARLSISSTSCGPPEQVPYHTEVGELEDRASGSLFTTMIVFEVASRPGCWIAPRSTATRAAANRLASLADLELVRVPACVRTARDARPLAPRSRELLDQRPCYPPSPRPPRRRRSMPRLSRAWRALLHDPFVILACWPSHNGMLTARSQLRRTGLRADGVGRTAMVGVPDLTRDVTLIRRRRSPARRSCRRRARVGQDAPARLTASRPPTSRPSPCWPAGPPRGTLFASSASNSPWARPRTRHTQARPRLDLRAPCSSQPGLRRLGPKDRSHHGRRTEPARQRHQLKSDHS